MTPPPPLTCTVAVKGMTVFKEVHAKEVQTGIVEGAQRKTNLHMQVKKSQHSLSVVQLA